MGDARDLILGTEPQEPQYITVEDFEGLDTLELLLYEGKGETSFLAKSGEVNYDQQKLQYLASVGVMIDPSWLMETGDIKPEYRALFLTSFIVTGYILELEDYRRGEANLEEFVDYISDINRQLHDQRIARYGERKVRSDGLTREERRRRKFNLSANPEKRVSEEELNDVLKFVFGQLHSRADEIRVGNLRKWLMH